MTGFSRENGIYELLRISTEIKQCVTVSPDIDKLREIGLRQGMHPLRVSGAMKVAAGVTTFEEVLKVRAPGLAQHAPALSAHVSQLRGTT